MPLILTLFYLLPGARANRMKASLSHEIYEGYFFFHCSFLWLILFNTRYQIGKEWRGKSQHWGLCFCRMGSHTPHTIPWTFEQNVQLFTLPVLYPAASAALRPWLMGKSDHPTQFKSAVWFNYLNSLSQLKLLIHIASPLLLISL